LVLFPLATDFTSLFLWMCFGHYLADFGLQNAYIAQAKNPTLEKGSGIWVHVMSAHCAIHAGLVALISSSWILGLLEFVTHFVIDSLTCKGKLSYTEDQIAHLACKFIWTTILVWALS